MRRPAHPPDLEVKLQRFFKDDESLNRPLPQGWRTPNDFGLPGELNDVCIFSKAIRRDLARRRWPNFGG